MSYIRLLAQEGHALVDLQENGKTEDAELAFALWLADNETELDGSLTGFGGRPDQVTDKSPRPFSWEPSHP